MKSMPETITTKIEETEVKEEKVTPKKEKGFSSEEVNWIASLMKHTECITFSGCPALSDFGYLHSDSPDVTITNRIADSKWIIASGKVSFEGYDLMKFENGFSLCKKQ